MRIRLVPRLQLWQCSVALDLHLPQRKLGPVLPLSPVLWPDTHSERRPVTRTDRLIAKDHRRLEFTWEQVPRASMRVICLSATISLALLSSLAIARQPAGEAIGHPPPLPGPRRLPSPRQQRSRQTTARRRRQAHRRRVTPGHSHRRVRRRPRTPTGPLPLANTGPGLNVVGPDGVTTKAVKAVPCGAVARETDGSTICVGISDESAVRKRR